MNNIKEIEVNSKILLYERPNLKGINLIRWDKSFNEYIEILREKKYYYDGIYTKSTIEMDHFCSEGHKFPTKPYYILNNGTECGECLKNKKLEKGNEEIIEILQKRNSDAKLLTKYKNISSDNDIDCGNGHVFIQSLSGLKRGRWCWDCYLKSVADKYYKIINDKKGKTDPYVDTFFENSLVCEFGHPWKTKAANIMNGHWCRECQGIDPEVCIMMFYMMVTIKNGEVLEEYKNRRTQVLLRCNTCRNEWPVTPTCIMKGHWCSICAGNNSIVAEIKLHEKVKLLNGKVLGKYINSYTHILLQCDKKHTWPAKPYNITFGNHWCPVCYGNSKVEAGKKIQKMIEDKGGKLLTPYNGKRSPITLSHFDKNVIHVWTTIAENIFQHCWCSICNESKGEREIRLFLEKHNIKFEKEFPVKINNSHYRFDFLLHFDNKVMIIEFDGEQHFLFPNFYHKDDDLTIFESKAHKVGTKNKSFLSGEEKFKKQQTADYVKTKWAIDNEIFILRIDYLNFNNIKTILFETLTDFIFCEYTQEKFDMQYMFLNDEFDDRFTDYCSILENLEEESFFSDEDVSENIDELE